MQNYSRKLIISLFIFSVINLVLSYILFRRIGILEVYISPSVLFVRGVLSLFLFTVGTTIFMIIFLLILRRSSKTYLRIILAVLAVIISIYIFAKISNYYDFSTLPGNFHLSSGDFGSIWEHFILITTSLILTITFYKKYDLFTEKTIKILLVISILFLVFSVFSIYLESKSLEKNHVDKKCTDLFNLVILRDSESAFSKGINDSFFKMWTNEDKNNRLTFLSNNFGDSCKENFDRSLDSYESWISRSSLDVVPESDKDILFEWANQ